MAVGEIQRAPARGPGSPVELLEKRARDEPDRVAFTFLDEPRTWGRLWRESRCFAASLRHRGLRPGDRLVLALPNGVEFFPAFFGALAAGCVAVPVFPGSSSGRLADLIRMCGASGLALPLEAPQPRVEVEVLRVESEPRSEGDLKAVLPRIDPENIAYIQYTSGSTGDPKGVQISHAALLCNVRQLIAGIGIRRQDVFVTWLPVYHDMGLVLMAMVPFQLGAELFILPADLRRPLAWAAAIERRRGTFTAAPDFAYRLLLSRLRGGGPDLSGLRIALNAAEPVRARTVRQFERAVGSPGVMVPAYGLAEATVGVSSRPPGSPLKVDATGNVAVGRPFPGVEVEIRADSAPVGPGAVGEILVAGPANTTGYYRNPRATEELFVDRKWIRTGDLGYLDEEGDLFVVGRTKNIIIHAGRNLSPREIEESVDPLPGVRYSAAVGIDRGDEAGEQIFCFVELRSGGEAGEDAWRRIAIEIVRAVHSRLGVRPARVLLLEPRTIPKTANGKIRHRALRSSHLDGSLRAAGSILFPPC